MNVQPSNAPGHKVNAPGWVVADGTVIRDGKALKLSPPDGQVRRAVGAACRPATTDENGRP
jgi:hypothetical protein